MNGHGTTETLAFTMMEISRRFDIRVDNADDQPLLILSATGHSGERELQARLSQYYSIALDTSIDPPLMDALARHLARTAMRAGILVAPSDATVDARREGAARLLHVANAQAAFLRATITGVGPSPSCWGAAFTDINGEYAIYLRLLFPGAKFIFLHRNPLDTFSASLEASIGDKHSSARDPRWAASFAEHWCNIVASFELWHREAGAIRLAYDDVICEAADGLERFVGVTPAEYKPARVNAPSSQLHPDDVQLIKDRTGELADRCGHRLATEAANDALEVRVPPTSAATTSGRSSDRGRGCAIVVPTMRYIEPECDAGLRELERRGYAVRRLHGCSAIDLARSRLATEALERGFTETFWIDADVAFDPDDIEHLRNHDLPIVCGIYAKKGQRELATALMPGTKSLTFGTGGGLIEILYAATGFLLVKRDVYQAIRKRFDLPLCNPSAAHRAVPFFMPMLEAWGGEMSHLPEDYAFWRRARLCGFKVMADTRIRLAHVGPYLYGFEDAGNAVARTDTYEYTVRRPPV